MKKKEMEKTSQTTLVSSLLNSRIITGVITFVLLFVGFTIYAYSEFNILSLGRFNVLNLAFGEGIILVTVLIITTLYSRLKIEGFTIFIVMLSILFITIRYEHDNLLFQILHASLYVASILVFTFAKRKDKEEEEEKE